MKIFVYFSINYTVLCFYVVYYKNLNKFLQSIISSELQRLFCQCPPGWQQR